MQSDIYGDYAAFNKMKTEDIFCVQYRSNEGAIHSGILNHVKAYSMHKSALQRVRLTPDLLAITV